MTIIPKAHPFKFVYAVIFYVDFAIEDLYGLSADITKVIHNKVKDFEIIGEPVVEKTMERTFQITITLKDSQSPILDSDLRALLKSVETQYKSIIHSTQIIGIEVVD